MTLDQVRKGCSLHTRGVFCGLMFAGVIFTTGCRQQDGATPQTLKRYHLEGVVVSKDAQQHELTVQAGAVAGLMPAMTMPYKLRDVPTFQAVQPGDRISSDVLATGTDDNYVLDRVAVVGQSRKRIAPGTP